jgi:hypothetical protein
LGWLSQFEWIIIEVLVLALLVWQLISVRRDMRKAGDKKRSDRVDPGAGSNSNG